MASTPMHGFAVASEICCSGNFAVFPLALKARNAGVVLPAARLQELAFLETSYGKTLHCAGHLLAGFGERLRIVVMCGGDDDSLGAGLCFGAVSWIVHFSLCV